MKEKAPIINFLVPSLIFEAPSKAHYYSTCVIPVILGEAISE
jgi:hypothetical protein